MKSYRHLFFDLDRTLWDFDRNSAEMLHEISDRFGLKEQGVDPDVFIRNYIEINASMWQAYGLGKVTKGELRTKRFLNVFDRMGIKNDALAETIGQYYVEHCPQKTGLLPHAMEVLEQLKQRYELHIITNGFDESQSTKLAASGIRHFFGHVITSSQSGFKKPAPAMFQWALEQVGAQADEALMIGDDLLVDVKGASDVGMDQVYFNPTKKTHNAEVTYEVSCLSQLPEILYEVN